MNLYRASEPDGYTPEGVPIYLCVGRGCGKSTLQLEMYRKLVGIPDDEWDKIKAEVQRRLWGGEDGEDDESR